MSTEGVAKILSAIAWPVVSIFFLVYAGKPLHQLLAKLSNAAMQSIRIKAFGTEFEMSLAEANTVFNELVQDFVDMEPPLVELFERIEAADGRLSVLQLLPNFKRVDGNAELTLLRQLRDRKLIRPFEGSNWQPEKHPMVTRFGRVIWKARTDAKMNKKQASR